MIRIDMTEEPEREDDLIFKAQNIRYNGMSEYLIPVQDVNGSVLYVTQHYYDNIINEYGSVLYATQLYGFTLDNE